MSMRQHLLSLILSFSSSVAFAQPATIQTVPGMPPVSNSTNLYSDTAVGKLSASVTNALARIYVPNRQSNDVYVIDPETMKVVDKFRVGRNPQHVVPSWDLKTLWVANNAEGRTDGTMTPIDPVTGKPGKPIAVDDPYNVYFTPDGRFAIIVAEARKRLDFRDAQTMKMQGSLPMPECGGVNHADFSIDGRYAIFTCEFSGKLAKVDMVDRKVIGYLKLSRGGMPQDIRVSPDGKLFLVADMHADGVHVIDGEKFAEMEFIKTGVGTHGVVSQPRRHQAVRCKPRLAQGVWSARRQRRQRVGGRLCNSQGRENMADSGWRQSRHGQRQRRWEDALAIGALR